MPGDQEEKTSEVPHNTWNVMAITSVTLFWNCSDFSHKTNKMQNKVVMDLSNSGHSQISMLLFAEPDGKQFCLSKPISRGHYD